MCWYEMWRKWIPESYGNFAFSIWVIVNCFTNWLLHYRHPHWLYIRISFSPHLISTHTLLFLFIISSSITVLRIMWWCALMALIWISLITVLVSHMSDSLQPHLCSPPGSSVHEILQARMLEWVAIPFSKGFYWPRDQTCVSCITGGFFTIWVIKEGPLINNDIK